MSNDSEIAVKLTAQSDDMQSGLAEAVSALRESTEAMTEGLKKLSESSEKAEGSLKSLVEGVKGILHIEEFNFLKEQAEAFFETVKSGFESTIGKAEEFGLANAKFAAIMGLSEETAAGLGAALRGVGSSSEEYTSIAERLQMKVNTNEKAMEELGIKTRDANGQILSGKDLMDSAISTLGTYKSGADQNAFAVQVFGKRAADVYNIMRVGDEQIQHQIDIFAEMGVTMTGSGSDAAQLEDALNDLHTMVEALGIKIGQELMPTAQAALEWMGTEGPAFLRELSEGIAELAKSFLLLAQTAIKSFEDIKDTLSGKKIGDAIDKNLKSALDSTGISKLVNSFVDATGPVDGAMQSQAAAADGTTSALDHLSAAWDKLIEGFGKVGNGGIAEQLGALPGGNAEEANDPLMQALSKQNPYKPAGGSRKYSGPAKKGPKDNSAEQEIQDEEKLALAKEKIEEATNAHRLAMGQESESAFLAQAVTAENATYQIKLEALNKELALGGQTKAQHQKLLDEMRLLSVEHEGALLKIKQEGETQQAALDKQSLADFLKSDDEKLKTYSASLADQVSVGKLSATEKDRLEIDFTQTVKREELARLDAHIATLTPGTKAYQAAVAERSALETKFTDDVKNKQKELAKDVEKDVKSWVGPMASSFTSAINSMIVEGKSFGDAMKELGKSLESALLTTFEKIAQNWLEMQITNAIVAKTSALANATTQITSEAAIAGAAGFADSASLGPIGLAAAPGVGAGAFAATMSYIGLASAAGGMVVDRDQLVYTHKNEMILPANLSGGLQSMISGGGGGGGDTNLHYNPVINGGNNADLAQLLRSQPSAMVAWLAQANRDGKLKARPGQ